MPEQILDYFYNTAHDQFVEFMTAHWDGDKEDLMKVWPSIVGSLEMLRLEAIKDNADNKELLADMESNFPKEGQVLYQIIQTSFMNKAFIVSFGRSWPPWAKKMWKMTSEKFTNVGMSLENAFRRLHWWKNDNIKPHIDAHPETFSKAGGVIGLVIYLGLQHVGMDLDGPVDMMLDHLPENIRELIPDDGDDMPGKAIGKLVIFGLAH
ncbi:hypothetical protein [Candidatus Nitrosotenuis cloacae]|uniref:hypothetical protein n=1 Tax=Candidatus Nitrosotenuis cloacae TaxID=1603555 RepID=UPI0022816396|nr:hypothetical protein [Candidatus Nitrosotenuis cloacae]